MNHTLWCTELRMNGVRCVLPAFLLIAAITVTGCKAKQEQPSAGSEKPGADSVQTTDKAAAPVASPQEKDDARAAAATVLEQFAAGNFAAIYKNATPGFKQIGSESQFVEKFQQTRLKVGALKNPKESSFETRPDNSHVLVYRLQNDHYNSDLRLTFVRAADGKMGLSGLNQHDEVKK